MEEFVFEREHAALRVDRGAHAMALLARVIGGHQMLAPVLDPFHGTLEFERGDRDEHVFGIELAPDAEAAAGVAFFQMHGGRCASQNAGEIVARAVRHLGRAVKLEHVVRRGRSAPSAPRVSSGTPEWRPMDSSSSMTCVAAANAPSRSP